MAVSKTRDQFEYTTEFAAVKAEVHEVAELLSRSRGFLKTYDQIGKLPIPIPETHLGFVVVFALPQSAWTMIDPIMSRLINLGAIERVTKKLNTEAVYASNCCNTGSFGYLHIKNGRTIEEFCCAEPEFHQLSIDEAKQKRWQLDSRGYSRFKTRRKIIVDLDQESGFELLSDLSDEIELEVPPELDLELRDGHIQFSHWDDSNNESSNLVAYLLHLR